MNSASELRVAYDSALGESDRVRCIGSGQAATSVIGASRGSSRDSAPTVSQQHDGGMSYEAVSSVSRDDPPVEVSVAAALCQAVPTVSRGEAVWQAA